MASNQQIVPIQKQAATVRALLSSEKSINQFRSALPRHIKAEQFLRVAMTTIQKNPDLLKCSQTSLIGCLMESAQLGLQVDGLLGEAHLVPFNNKQKDGTWRKECQLIPGYKGYMKLGRNSGEVATFIARTVYKDDFFEYEDGLEPKLVHRRSENPPAIGPNENIENFVRGAYAIARMKDGSYQFIFLWKWEIDRRRAASRAKSGPWFDNYPSMCEKSAIRALAKWIPQSPELQRATALEDLAEAGITQDIDCVVEEDTGEIVPAPAALQGTNALDAIVAAETANKEIPAQYDASLAPTPEPKARGKAAPKPEAKTLENPNYAEGSDPDPFTGTGTDPFGS